MSTKIILRFACCYHNLVLFQNWLWHLLEDGVDLLLLVVGLPEVVEGEELLGDLLDLVHIHSELSKPGPDILTWRE